MTEKQDGLAFSRGRPDGVELNAICSMELHLVQPGVRLEENLILGPGRLRMVGKGLLRQERKPSQSQINQKSTKQNLTDQLASNPVVVPKGPNQGPSDQERSIESTTLRFII